MFFQFLTILNVKLSFMITANASSCCAKQLEYLSSSLYFFFPLFLDCEQQLWTGVKATTGILVSSWRKGHLGRISVVQEKSSIKRPYKKQAGKNKTTSEWKHGILPAGGWAPCRASPHGSPVLVTQPIPGQGHQPLCSLGARGLPQVSTLPALQPHHPLQSLGLSHHSFPLSVLHCVSCPDTLSWGPLGACSLIRARDRS